MSDTGTPELYDIEVALRELAKARRLRDEPTRQMIHVGDSLALHIDRHFPGGELETAGRALLIAAGAMGTLAEEGVHASAVVNILGFTAARLIRDGRDFKASGEAEAPDA